jgi:prophage antirepressor-like protein
MPNIIKVFQYEGRQIRTVTFENGDPGFIAKDVCDVLEIGNSRMALERLDDDEKGVISTDTPGGTQEMQAVTESGLYSLVLGSRKPEAKQFKRWITHEVLPAIRKTGQYIARPASQIEVLAQTVQVLVEQDKAIKELAATQNQQAAELQQIREAIVANHNGALRAGYHRPTVEGGPQIPIGAAGLDNIYRLCHYLNNNPKIGFLQDEYRYIPIKEFRRVVKAVRSDYTPLIRNMNALNLIRLQHDAKGRRFCVSKRFGADVIRCIALRWDAVNDLLSSRTVETKAEFLNATKIGTLIGTSAIQVNRMLLAKALQYQEPDHKGGKRWRITEQGKHYGEEISYSKNGISYYQLRWGASVLTVIRQRSQ